MNSGRLVQFTEKMPEEQRASAILGASSIPGAFSPARIHGLNNVDGGIFENLGLAHAITSCREEGVDDEDIIIDILLCFNVPNWMDEWDYEEAKNKSPFDLY